MGCLTKKYGCSINKKKKTLIIIIIYQTLFYIKKIKDNNSIDFYF